MITIIEAVATKIFLDMMTKPKLNFMLKSTGMNGRHTLQLLQCFLHIHWTMLGAPEIKFESGNLKGKSLYFTF